MPPRLDPRVSPAPAQAGLETQNSTQLSAPDGVSTGVGSITLDQAGLAGLQGPKGLGAKEAPLGRSASTAISGAERVGGSSDADLMLRLQAGDDAAFDLLVEKFRRPIVSFMYRMARNQAVAEELAQEVFLRVYRSRRSYAASAKFSTWLYRIATNLALNHIRDTKNERAEASLSLDERDETTGKCIDLADHRRTAEEAIVHDERMLAIRRHVESLPERQRLAIIMHKYQEMDYREISRVLKLSESATKSLLFRAYETLREKLKDFV